MRKNPTHEIEEYRVQYGPFASTKRDGANGMFLVPDNLLPGVPQGFYFKLIVSDGTTWRADGLTGMAWEHASISLPGRCPTWAEMDWFKRLLWRDDETVIQLHVPRSEHVNAHPHCLHLWRPIGVEIPRPPVVCVGPLEGVR